MLMGSYRSTVERSLYTQAVSLAQELKMSLRTRLSEV